MLLSFSGSGSGGRVQGCESCGESARSIAYVAAAEAVRRLEREDGVFEEAAPCEAVDEAPECDPLRAAGHVGDCPRGCRLHPQVP